MMPPMMPPELWPEVLPTMGRPIKYPFDDIEVGGHFIIPGDSMKPMSAKTYCIRKSKALNKRFRCMETRHGDSFVWRES